jgi:hypothetical protein
LLTNLTFSPTGTNRTLTIIPNTNSVGATPITVTVTDDGVPAKTTTATFILLVRASTNVVLNDLFDYDASADLVTVSGGLWTPHSGSGAISVGSGVAGMADTSGQDISAPLIGQPYTTNGGGFIYSSFKVNWSLPPTGNGGYFAHFKDSGTANFRARVYARATNTVAHVAADPGTFFIGNSSQSDTTLGDQVTNVLTTNITYTVVTRYDITNVLARIWLNPTSESSPSVDATDPVLNVPPTIDVVTYALRQGGTFGTLTLDDLRVARTFLDVLPGSSPDRIPLSIKLAGPNAVLTWSNPAFSLASATNVAGTYTKILPLATSPYTNTASGTLFFRLIYP